jgi:SAM-dependent methyltransferase
LSASGGDFASSRLPSEEAVERIEPAETSALELALHVSRYRFVAPFVAGRCVLDAGCGVGYGSGEFTSEPAARYLGVDRSVGAIRLARGQYAAPGRLFLVGNVGALPFEDGQFDIVLSFEVVEHLEEVDRYLAELRRVLRPGGTCVVSTPNKRWFSDGLAAPRNPYHVREYYPAEFAHLLGVHFPDVTLMGQHDGARVRVVRSAEAAYRQFLERMGLRRLRHLVPARLRTWVHSMVVNVASWGRGVRPAAIEPSDYTFTTDNVDDARVLLGICRVL